MITWKTQVAPRLDYVTTNMCIKIHPGHLPRYKKTNGRFLGVLVWDAEGSSQFHSHTMPSLSIFIGFYHNHLGFWVIGTIRVINWMFAIKTEDQGGLHYRLNIFRKLYQAGRHNKCDQSNATWSCTHCANWFALELKSPQKTPKCLKK